ncbi:hypothetical protein V1527DRAFT_287977 [Lipomyces starkeyi]
MLRLLFILGAVYLCFGLVYYSFLSLQLTIMRFGFIRFCISCHWFTFKWFCVLYFVLVKLARISQMFFFEFANLVVRIYIYMVCRVELRQFQYINI